MRLFPWKRAPKHTFDAPLAPDLPFHAIGDVHGRADLLARALDGALDAGAPVVCVGDYVDRGDDSRAVLDLVQDRQAARPGALICLMGNHERMLIEFLDDPAGQGRRWLRHGGLQTLASYRVRAIAETAPPDAWSDLRDRFRAALGQTEAWLRDLPLHWQSGNVAVIHAGADPGVPIDVQEEQSLLWGHPGFLSQPRTDGVWVVHGHTIVDQPQVAQGRIAIDTGAYATGRLTVARIAPDGVTFD